MTPPVTVIGCDGGPLPAEAAGVLAAASLVVGARRQLAAAAIPGSARQCEISQLDDALDEICRASGPVAVLASGDPGFFGIVRSLRARGILPRIIPAVSSVALAFARLGLDWDDALVLSAHGRSPRPVAAAALAHPKVAILTAPGGAAEQLAVALLAAGRRVYVAERLGEPAERVAELTADAAANLADPNVLVAVDPAVPPAAQPGWVAGHRGAPAGWALPEEAFAHRDSMITKSEVRAVVLARLGPGLGRTVWDLGSGSGSVAVECARFGASVIAIEADPGQCSRIGQNAAIHGVAVRIVQGRAPGILAGLPAPDALFVGGGDDAGIAAAVELGRPYRAVVTLASVDRVRTVSELLAGHGYQVSGVQLQASRLASLPGGSLRLAAVNPVFVLSGERGTQ
ncbi:MAG TPA: precorrin-6y C5,15-methyltransferase (decarboxylating) subunit CbiE [Streptosporangiaceae bacterium]|nr:precorrin-6y C5,15-methyltransferase (decarboxylating) subunit CbiE [Streptosporangiaceae bacterium]